jgi:MoxR-like ATPase
MFKLVITYPDRGEELEVLDRMTGEAEPVARPVMHPGEVLRLRRLTQQVYVDRRVKEYVLDLIAATRQPGLVGLGELAPLLEFGASPRGAIFLIRAAKVHAFLDGRGYVTPDDIKALALDVLRHRLILSYRADAEGVGSDTILGRIVEAVRVP